MDSNPATIEKSAIDHNLRQQHKLKNISTRLPFCFFAISQNSLRKNIASNSLFLMSFVCGMGNNINFYTL